MNGYIHAYISTYLHTYVHVCMHACMHACAHSYMQEFLHGYMYAPIRLYIQYKHACISIQIHIPHTTCTRTQIYAHWA